MEALRNKTNSYYIPGTMLRIVHRIFKIFQQLYEVGSFLITTLEMDVDTRKFKIMYVAFIMFLLGSIILWVPQQDC